jgi:hypothetical protein
MMRERAPGGKHNYPSRRNQTLLPAVERIVNQAAAALIAAPKKVRLTRGSEFMEEFVPRLSAAFGSEVRHEQARKWVNNRIRSMRARETSEVRGELQQSEWRMVSNTREALSSFSCEEDPVVSEWFRVADYIASINVGSALPTSSVIGPRFWVWCYSP